MSKKLDILLILVVKLSFALFCTYVLSEKMRLGDNPDYIMGLYLSRNDILSPAYLLSIISTLLGHNALILNLLGAVAGSAGIIFCIRSVSLTKSKHIVLLILFLTPSFTLWSSIYSKEPLIIFFSGLMLILLKALALNNRNIFLFILSFVCLLALIYFKRYYSPIFIFSYFFSVILIYNKAVWIRQLFVIFIVSFSFLVVSAFWNEIGDYISQVIPPHFDIEGSSSRENINWATAENFWLSFLINPLQGFVGPVISELGSNFVYPFVFAESMVLMFLISYIALLAVLPRFDPYVLFYFLGIVLLVLFVQYVFGFINAGTAVRYRTDVVVFLSAYLLFVSDLRKAQPR